VAFRDENVSDSLWARWHQDRSKETRDALILHYGPLVRYVANRVGSKLPQTVEIDDLISYGTFGLIDAIEKFEVDRGWKFETYAMARIKGAIFDELRNLDWVPRSVRSQARSIDSARTRLEATLHRQPTPSELAAEVGIDEDDLTAVLHDVTSGSIGTLDPSDEMLEDRQGYRHSGIEVDELRAELTRALRTLSDREAIVFILYYGENLTLAEIGVVLGVTESRVVQIHSEAVQRVCRVLMA
jgi:RNA polymerase sigma factor for flagellar operon FliA